MYTIWIKNDSSAMRTAGENCFIYENLNFTVQRIFSHFGSENSFEDSPQSGWQISCNTEFLYTLDWIYLFFMTCVI